MEICKFVDNQYPDMNSVIRVANYIFNMNKSCGYTGAVSTCVHNCIDEIYLVKRYFNKLDGQNLIHIVVSMPVFENMEKDELRKLAFHLTSYFANRHQAIFGVHFKGCGESPNTHIHIAINTVSFVDGYKISAGYDLKAEFRKFVNGAIKLYKNNKLQFRDNY